MRGFGNTYAQAEIGGEFKKLPAGGYVCEITNVEDKPDKQYLLVTYDIATGPYKGYYSDEWGKAHIYAHSIYKSYKDANMRYFRGFITCIDKSNGTNFDSLYAGTDPVNEKLLIGKRIGLVIAYEEYMNDRGEKRERTYVHSNRSVQAIEAGDYEVPDVKPLNNTPATAPATIPPEFQQIKDDEIPF